jgi:uroporphyrinogen-III synthase
VTTPVIAIRPEPGCSATVEAGIAMGLLIECHPLLYIRPLAWAKPSPAEIDALLLGSANAVRHGGPELAAFRGKPAYAVGEATGAAAEAAGFTVAAVGRGGLQSLLDTLAAPLRLLRLAGAEHVALLPPSGMEIVTRVVYEAVAAPLAVRLARRLGGGALVLLHSAAAARHFAVECDRCEVPRGAVSLAALGPRIAEAAGTGWHEVRFAPQPHEAALLALAREMCHEPPTG